MTFCADPPCWRFGTTSEEAVIRIARVLCVAPALTGWAPITHAQTVYIPKPGDLNADQQVDAADLGVMLRWIADPGQCTARQFRLADLDGSGELDERDLTALALRISTRTSLQDCVLVAPCCRFIWPHGCCSIATERCIEIGGQPGDPEQGGIDDTGPPGGGGSGGGSDGGAATIGGPGPNPGGGSGGGNNNDPCAFMLAVAGADDELVELGRIVGAGGALRTIGSITLHAVDRDERPVNVTWRIRGPSDEEFSQSSSASTFAVGGPPGLYTVRVHKQDCGAHDVQVHIYDFKVKSVTFGGGNHPVIDEFAPNEPYEGPHWLDVNGDGFDPQDGDRILPVAYTRDTHITIESVEFHIDAGEDNDPPDTFAVQAVDDYDLGLMFFGLNDDSYESTEPLPDKVDSFASFRLLWRVSFDGQHRWHTVGSTSQPLYVTLDDPVDNNLGGYYEGVYAISCGPARGAADQHTAAFLMWQPFHARHVGNRVGQTLGYYRGGPCDFANFVTDHRSLLVQGNAQCHAWADLFMAALNVQGIDARIVRVEPDPARLPLPCGIGPIQMLIKNYDFAETGLSNCLAYPFRLNTCVTTPWQIADCTDVVGAPGQHSPNPASLFNQHFIVFTTVRSAIGPISVHFDPSYGNATYLEELDWSSQSLAGFAATANGSAQIGARPRTLNVREVLFTPRDP